MDSTDAKNKQKHHQPPTNTTDEPDETKTDIDLDDGLKEKIRTVVTPKKPNRS